MVFVILRKNDYRKVKMGYLEAVFFCLRDCIEYHLIYERFNNSEQPIEEDTISLMNMCSDACLQMSYVLWCKVFGSARNNRLHWTKYIGEAKFYSVLEGKYGLTRDAFEKYVKAVTTFRNKYVAHGDEYTNAVPVFDNAKKSIFALSDLLADSLNEFGSLESYCEVSGDKYSDIMQRFL